MLGSLISKLLVFFLPHKIFAPEEQRVVSQILSYFLDQYVT